MVYPWQQSYWERFLHQRKQNTLSHAYLLQGLSGLGKHAFSEKLCRLLLCHQAEFTEDCHCVSCSLGKEHPDGWFKSEETIKIDAIRELTEWLFQTPQISQRKVVLISHAEKMTLAAANALLKTLEEPPSYAIIILVSDHSKLLPATIRSRCQLVSFSPVFDQMSVDWLKKHIANPDAAQTLLKATYGAPLKALAYETDGKQALQQKLLEQWCAVGEGTLSVVEFSKQWLSSDILWALNSIYTFLYEKILADMVYSGINKKVNVSSLFACVGQLLFLKQQLNGQVNLNQQLLFESLALKWKEVFCYE